MSQRGDFQTVNKRDFRTCSCAVSCTAVAFFPQSTLSILVLEKIAPRFVTEVVGFPAGKSALHWAAAVNNVEATLVLLKNGANRDMQDNKVQSGCAQRGCAS